MIPGCILWVGAYFAVGASAYRLWQHSPWLLLGAVVAVVIAAWSFTTLRRKTTGRAVRQPAE
jgi:membrane protein DedA with SNARE-associated domain